MSNGQLSNGQLTTAAFNTVEEYIASHRETVDPKAMLDVLLAQTSRLREENQMNVAETRELAEVELTADWDFKPKNLAGLWRLGKMFSQSGMVPDHYKNKPADCAIAAQMALRCGVPIMMFLQSSYVVHGTPGIRATLAIAMLNKSGLIDGRVHFKMDYDSGNRPTACLAYVKDKQSGEQIDMRIDWGIVAGEGWNRDKEKNGVTYKSKWNTMPELMFKYRAAAWLIRQNYPDVILGMQTTEELEDTETQLKLAQAESRAANLQAEMAGLEQRLAGPTDQVVVTPSGETPIGQQLAKAKAEREAKAKQPPDQGAAGQFSDGAEMREKIAEGEAIDRAKAKMAGQPEAGGEAAQLKPEPEAAKPAAKAPEGAKAKPEAAKQPEAPKPPETGSQPAKAPETPPAATGGQPAKQASKATPSRQKAAAATSQPAPAAADKPATASPATGKPAAPAEKALPGMEPDGPAGEVLDEIPLGAAQGEGGQQPEVDDFNPGPAPAEFDIGDWQAKAAATNSLDAVEEIRNDAAMNLQPDDYQEVLTVLSNRESQIKSKGTARQNRF